MLVARKNQHVWACSLLNNREIEDFGDSDTLLSPDLPPYAVLEVARGNQYRWRMVQQPSKA